MFAPPIRVSPPRSMVHSLPASPVLAAAAPAVVIRHSIDRPTSTATATPALTLHSSGSTTPAPPSPPRTHAPPSAATYYTPAVAVVATPVATMHEAPHYRQHHTTGEVQHYCEHHAPKQRRTTDAYHVSYQPPAPCTHYTGAVYEAAPQAVPYYPSASPSSAPSYACGHASPSAAAAHYYASALLSFANPQSMSAAPAKPQPVREALSVPFVAVGSSSGGGGGGGGGSAFRPVHPIAMYPRSGIMIR